MPDNLNITQITPPRVAMIDERTGAVTREWYRFFYNLYYATGGTTGGFIPPGKGGTGTGTIPADGQLLVGDGVTGVYNVTDLGTGDGIAKTVGHGTLSIENTGVLSNIGGDGISVNNPTGNVTITNTGVLSITGGRGIGANAPTGNVTISTTAVLGPTTSTDNAIAVYDGITGDAIKNSTVVINPSTGALTSGISGGTF